MADLIVQHEGPADGNTAENFNEPDGPFIVMLRGIPFETSTQEIFEFLSDCTIKNGEQGIHILIGPDSRPTGHALIELESHKDQVTALNHDRDHMGHRYVEVTFVTKDQFDAEMTRQPGASGSGDYVVRLRGLPYSAQVKDILSLLSDCQVMNGEKGVFFTFTPDGRPSGQAFVELCSEEDVSKALGHNREHMGKRYVEIFRASRGQMEWDCRLEDKYGGGAGTGVVRLRGLPYRCTEEQVKRFFSGLKIVPGGIVLQVDNAENSTGVAFVEFSTKEDAEHALEKDRQEIDHRYIEVFRSTHAEICPVKNTRPTPYSRPGGSRGGGGGGGGGGNYGGYGGYGMKHGSGYMRSYRGRGGGRGGGPPPHFAPFDTYGEPFYEDQDYYSGPGGGGGGGFPHHGGPPHGGGPPGDANLVSYPPIRPSHSQPTRGGYGAGGGMGPGVGGGMTSQHVVRMRGLPYSAKDKDILDFFAPIIPLKVTIDTDHYGRQSGEAEVMFKSHEDATVSMQKNRQNIGHRYIELFLHSSDDVGVPGAGGVGPPQGGVAAGRFAPGGLPQQQQQSGWSDPRAPQQQPRPLLSEQPHIPQLMSTPGGTGYVPASIQQQQQQQPGAVGMVGGQYGGGGVYQQAQQPQQTTFQHTTAGYGMSGGYGDQQQASYQTQQSHDSSYAQQQQQWGGY